MLQELVSEKLKMVKERIKKTIISCFKRRRISKFDWRVLGSKQKLLTVVSLLIIVILGSFNFFSISKASSAAVQFTDDVIVNLDAIGITLYLASGSICNSLTVTNTDLNVDSVLANNVFLLKTDSYNVLQLTPLDDVVSFSISNGNFSSGYLSQWTQNSSVSVDSVIAVINPDQYYGVQADGNDIEGSPFYSGVGSEVTFFRVGGGISEIFLIAEQGTVVRFVDDVKIDLEGVSSLYISSGAWCQSIDVSGTNFEVQGIMSNYPFFLKSSVHKVLQLTPVGGVVGLQLASANFANGFLSQWQETSSISVDHLIGVEQVNKNYTIEVDNNNIPDNPFDAGVLGEISFVRTGLGAWETFLAAFTEYPIAGQNLELDVLDAGEGVAFNSIMWQGTQPELIGEANCTGPNYKCVLLQLATSSNPDGPWNYLGPDCTVGSYYTPNPDAPQEIGCCGNHYNHRYYKIKFLMYPDNVDRNISPTIEKIIVNYAP